MSAVAFKEMLLEYNRRVLAAAETGGAEAGSLLLREAITQAPGVPLDEGTLRGSGSVHVNGKFVQASENVGGEPTPYTRTMQAPRPDKVVVTVGFNTAYAAVMHEGGWETGPLAGKKIEHYKTAGTGAKFLERPQSDNRDQYMQVIADRIREAKG